MHEIAYYGAVAALCLGGGFLALLVGLAAKAAAKALDRFANSDPAPICAENCPCTHRPAEGAHGAYEEPDHVREKREAYVRNHLSRSEREFAEARQAARGRA